MGVLLFGVCASLTTLTIQYGKNKENDKLPQLNLLLVFGEKSGLPFYYRKLAGNIPDSKTVKHLLEELDILGFDTAITSFPISNSFLHIFVCLFLFLFFSLSLLLPGNNLVVSILNFFSPFFIRKFF